MIEKEKRKMSGENNGEESREKKLAWRKHLCHIYKISTRWQ